MRVKFIIAFVLGVVAAILIGLLAARPKADAAEAPAPAIPHWLAVEHEAIHATLVEATKAPGEVGVAARELAGVLHAHFVREEEIALPPLGLLAPLAAGEKEPAGAKEALAMSDALKAELPRMLEEHKVIRAAVEKLRVAAVAEKSAKFEQLAVDLALHAQSEEDVFYPAAVLVGEVLRARAASH